MSEGQYISGGSVNWGIVGAGAIAKHFAEDLAYCKQSVLVAVQSRSIEKASAFASNYHDVTPYASLSQMLADKRIDAIYIALPNDLHYAAARTALESDKAVLIEKPIAITSKQAMKLSTLANERGRFLMEAMWSRFLPSFSFVKEMVASGAFGDVKHISCDLAFYHPNTGGSRFYDKARGGGALLDLGVYPISLSLALMGRPDTIQGSWKAAAGGVDKSANVQLSFGDVTADLNCAIDREGSNLLIVEGTKGSLILQPPFIGAQSVLSVTGGPFKYLALAKGTSVFAKGSRYFARKFPMPGVKRHRFNYPGYGLQFEIDAASNAIANGLIGHPVAPISDSIETLQIIETVLDQQPGLG